MAEMTPTFRQARADEDEVCARVLFNAFRLNWDINWWQNLSEPVHAVATNDVSRYSRERLATPQSVRLEFYRATLRLVRRIGGVVCVACLPSRQGDERVAAVLCWLPPGTKMSWWDLIRSNLLLTALQFGISGMLRFLYFEHVLGGLSGELLRPLGFPSRNHGSFVQILGTSPDFTGMGLSARLLQWQIAASGQMPVFLDTAGDYQQKVYEKLGFKLLGKRTLDIVKIDDNGLYTTQPGRADRFILRVMMLEQQTVTQTP